MLVLLGYTALWFAIKDIAFVFRVWHRGAPLTGIILVCEHLPRGLCLWMLFLTLLRLS